MSNSPTAGIVLLCVDLQPVFLRAIADGAKIQRRCEFALSAAVGLGLSVAFTEQIPQKLGGTGPELRALAPGAPVFGKNTFSALADAGVRDALLASRKFDHFLLCGLETPVCVYQTALDALAAGHQVTILSDCVGARRDDDASVCAGALIQAGVHWLPSETVFYSLLRDVQHPFFKAYTQLVKNFA